MAQTDQRFEQLKQKYQPPLNVISEEQVRLQNLNMQGGKLFVRAEAPSQDAKNKVWDEIKLIDQEYADLTADIIVYENQAPKAQTAGATVGTEHSNRTYTVKPEDSLSKISKEFYGTSGSHTKILAANRDKAAAPNKIQPEQEAVMPE